MLIESAQPPAIDESLAWDEEGTVPVSLGTVAGRYALQHELGHGGMGAVFSALDLRTDETVAVKLMGDKRSCSRKERFLREADATLALRHPNIVRLLDFGIDERNGYFQVLELLVGETLFERMTEGVPLSAREATSIVHAVLGALQLAHQQGIVHRDLKPENIFLAQESGALVPKLIDFGIARELGSVDRITSDGLVLGTPLYMAPEQIRGNDVGPAVDFWALGIITYQLAFGARPFQSRNLPDLYFEQTRGLRKLPFEHPLGALILACLSFDPNVRLSAIGEFFPAVD